MGHKHLILLLGLVALMACHTPTREAHRMVRRAELLADALPDSTARLIDSVLRMPVSFSERERMDMALLQAEALFGCRDGVHTVSPIMDDDFFDDHGNPSTSPELERAAAYYAGKKQYAKAAHAALYSGFVQQHYNEKEAAMRSFKDAEHYGGIVGDSLTVAQAEFKIGRMLHGVGMKDEAIVLLRAADRGFGNRNAERALVQNMIAVCYMVKGDYANADSCLQLSLLYSENGHYDKAKRKAMNNYAVLYQLQGDYPKAIRYLKRLEMESDNSRKLLLYLNLGDVFASCGQVDSAAFYYQQLSSVLPNSKAKMETQISAYNSLSLFAENQGDDALALQYWKQYSKLLDNMRDKREQNNVYGIQQKYDYESLQNTMNQRLIQKHRIILIISLLLFVSAIIIWILQYRHKQLLESEKEMKQQIEAMKQDLRQTVKSSVVDNEISSRLRMILLANRTTQRANDPKKEWQPLIKQIMNGEQKPFEAARDVLEMAYPCLYSTILENYPSLTETESKVYLLSCSELSNAEIAEFLGLSLNTVNQNRSNLRKKLNLKPDRMKEQLRNSLTKKV